MAAQAAVVGLQLRGTPRQRAGIWLAVGGALFLASDALLATNRFAAPLPLSGLWILLSYWLALVHRLVAGAGGAPRRLIAQVSRLAPTSRISAAVALSTRRSRAVALLLGHQQRQRVLPGDAAAHGLDQRRRPQAGVVGRLRVGERGHSWRGPVRPKRGRPAAQPPSSVQAMTCVTGGPRRRPAG